MNTFPAPRTFRSLLTTLATAALLTSSAIAAPFANTLWFSGDPNVNDWGNQGFGGITYYQGFTVSNAAGWTISDVFSIGPDWSLANTAEWQIRTGMSGGNGGTIVAGGTGLVSNSSYLGHNVMSVNVGSLYLTQGNYWLEVAGGAITLSNGANSIGTNTTTIRNWPLFSQNYYDLTYIGPVSEGVVGQVGQVPDSGSLLSLVLGLGTLFVLRKRRFACR